MRPTPSLQLSLRRCLSLQAAASLAWLVLHLGIGQPHVASDLRQRLSAALTRGTPPVEPAAAQPAKKLPRWTCGLNNAY